MTRMRAELGDPEAWSPSSLFLTGYLIAAVEQAYKQFDERAAKRFGSKASGYGAQEEVAFSNIMPKFVGHVLIRSKYSILKNIGEAGKEWEWVPDAVIHVARLYERRAAVEQFAELGKLVGARINRQGKRLNGLEDSVRDPRSTQKEFQQAAIELGTANAAFMVSEVCVGADTRLPVGERAEAFNRMMLGAGNCIGYSEMAKGRGRFNDPQTLAREAEAQRLALSDYANELLSLLSEASVKGVRAGHASEREQQYLNPRKRVRNDMPSAGSMGRKVWAKMRSKKRFSLHDASKATGLSEVKVRVAVGWLKEHGYLRAEGGKYVPSHASFRVNPEPGVADCREAWESYCEKPDLEIAACREAWDHYCARPNKTRLRAVLKILESMKGSKSAKVRAERTRCLRAAKPEAKALGL